MENGGSKGDVPEDANDRKKSLPPMVLDYYLFPLFFGVWVRFIHPRFLCFLDRLAIEEGVFSFFSWLTGEKIS